jgi:hypothetical protein
MPILSAVVIITVLTSLPAEQVVEALHTIELPPTITSAIKAGR